MKKILYFLTVVCLLLCFSCKEEEDIVGKGLQISTDSIFTDTLNDILFFSVMEDSLACSRVTSSLLGDVIDPLFGNVPADVYAQFRLASNAIDFGENPELDSVVLSVSYSGFFGDTLQSVTLGVYELSESLHKDSVYYTNQSLAFQPLNLIAGSSNFCFRPKTKVMVDSMLQEAQLRIPLSKDFFTNRFLEKSGADELANNANFLEYFKGVVIKAEGKSVNGCIAYLNMYSQSTAITLYYHNKDHDSLYFQLVSNDSTIAFSHVVHQFTSATADLQAQVLQKDYSKCGESAFLQAGSGIKARLSLPCLDQYANRRIAIHKAELVISRAEVDGYKPFFAPAALTMYYKKDSTSASSYYMPDLLKMGAKYFGGGIDTNDNSYRFLLTNYVQQVLMGSMSADYPLYVVVNAAATQATRLQIVGPHSTLYPDRRLRLILTYSLIPE